MAQYRTEFEKILKEKIALKSNVYSSPEQSLVKIFKYYDLNNNGQISFLEFARAIEKLGINSFNQSQLKEIFTFYDSDESGALSYKEFSKIIYGNQLIKKVHHDDARLSKQNLNLLTTLQQRGIRGIFILYKSFLKVDPDRSNSVVIKDAINLISGYKCLSEEEVDYYVYKYQVNKNFFNYKQFLEDLIGELDVFRTSVVKQTYTTLDPENKGYLDVSYLKQNFKTRGNPEIVSLSMSEGEVIEEFIDCLDSFTWIVRGVTATSITKKEFIDFYKSLSSMVDSNEYFEKMVKSHFGSGDAEVTRNFTQIVKDSNLNNNNNLNDNTPKRKNYRPDQQEHFHISKQITEENETKTNSPNKQDVKRILNRFRDKVTDRGCRGALSIARMFRIADKDDNNNLDYVEFKNICKELKLMDETISENDVNDLFNHFDMNKNGNIQYDEFLRVLRGPMNSYRRNLVQKAFDKLDRDKSGKVDVHDIKGIYDTHDHPDVKNGKKSEEEVLEEFLETFEVHHNLSNNKDRVVEFDEFLEYYSYISVSIDSDQYFELMLKSAWRLDEFADKKLNQWAGTSTRNTTTNESFDPKSSYLWDHHKSQLCGGVSASAPFGTNDNLDKNLLNNRSNRTASRSAPFGTDNNEYLQNIPRFDHRHFGNTKNSEQVKRTALKDGNHIQPVTNVIHVLREKMSRRGTRSWFNLLNHFRKINPEVISLQQLNNVLRDLRFDLEMEQINQLRNAYNTNSSNTVNSVQIDFISLINDMVYVTDKRENIINNLFKQMVGLKKVINVEFLKNSFTADNHPLLKNNRNKSDLTGEFVDCLMLFEEILYSEKEWDLRNFRFFWLLFASNSKDDSMFELTLRRVFSMENEDLGYLDTKYKHGLPWSTK